MLAQCCAAPSTGLHWSLTCYWFLLSRARYDCCISFNLYHSQTASETWDCIAFLRRWLWLYLVQAFWDGVCSLFKISCLILLSICGHFKEQFYHVGSSNCVTGEFDDLCAWSSELAQQSNGTPRYWKFCISTACLYFISADPLFKIFLTSMHLYLMLYNVCAV